MQQQCYLRWTCMLERGGQQPAVSSEEWLRKQNKKISQTNKSQGDQLPEIQDKPVNWQQFQPKSQGSAIVLEISITIDKVFHFVGLTAFTLTLSDSEHPYSHHSASSHVTITRSLPSPLPPYPSSYIYSVTRIHFKRLQRVFIPNLTIW